MAELTKSSSLPGKTPKTITGFKKSKEIWNGTRSKSRPWIKKAGNTSEFGKKTSCASLSKMKHFS